jgi:transposase
MAWGTVDVKDQRVRFVVSAKRGDKTMRALCEEFAITRPTGYEWLRRYTAGGIAGVVEKSRRPRSSPKQTAAKIEDRVVELREQRPDWGARKLQVLPGAGRDCSSGDHRASDFIAARFGAGAGPFSHGGGTLRAAGAEPAVADGL